ncbi:MAG: lytic murein transglycosylase, partial [Actinomycetota bacterium]|nr:lytic murein transglycosylase [Actinomycetota bacterium]
MGGSQPGSQPYVSQEPSSQAVSDIPSDYLALYRSAASEEGIDWAVLAAVGKVETGHGSNMGTSSAGAQGPMQFMPDTWASVGRDANGDGTADIMDPEDAIPTAATYLRMNGAPDDYTQALFSYNHSDAYVQEVLGIAEEYRAAESSETLALVNAVAVVRDVTTLGMQIPVAHGQMNGSNAVDENNNVHYESNTSYGAAWDHAVSSWNAGGAINVAPSPGGGETDLYVGDGDLPGSTMGHTSISGGDGGEGEVIFDTPIMSGATQNAQKAAAAHELGHVFSFEHTGNASVMYTPINSGSSDNWETPTDYDWSVYN